MALEKLGWDNSCRTAGQHVVEASGKQSPLVRNSWSCCPLCQGLAAGCCPGASLLWRTLLLGCKAPSWLYRMQQLYHVAEIQKTIVYGLWTVAAAAHSHACRQSWQTSFKGHLHYATSPTTWHGACSQQCGDKRLRLQLSRLFA